MADPGKLVVAIPTGYGTNGIRKEALAMLLNLISEMSVDGVVTKKWGSYNLPDPDPAFAWYTRKKWGMIVTAEVNDLEHYKRIVQDFGFDLGDHPKDESVVHRALPHIKVRNPYSNYNITIP